MYCPASTAQESEWLQQLLADLQKEPVKQMIIFEDNQSSISMAKNPQSHGSSKHIAFKYHFIREQVKNGKVELKYCKTDEIIADFMTKGLSSEKFEKLKLMAGMASIIEHPEASEGVLKKSTCQNVLECELETISAALCSHSVSIDVTFRIH